MEQISILIKEYYDMKDGEFIENHLGYFVVWEDEIEVRIKNRTIKHIVESRKRDGYDTEKIRLLINRIYDLLNNPYNFLNNEPNNSYLISESNARNNAAVMALGMIVENDALYIKTAFFRAVTKIK